MLYTKDVTITDTTLTTILTVPSGYVAYWTLLFISNHAGSTKSVTVYWDKATGTDLYIVDDKNIGSKDYVQFNGGTIVLQPGDSIMAQAEASCNFGIACTVELQPAPQTTVEFNGS